MHNHHSLIHHILIVEYRLRWLRRSIFSHQETMAAYVQDVIMLVGDSITQGGFVPNGFAQKLSCESTPNISLTFFYWLIGYNFVDVYCRKLDVLNRGLSGYNTTWGIPAFDQVCKNAIKVIESTHQEVVRVMSPVLRETTWTAART